MKIEEKAVAVVEEARSFEIVTVEDCKKADNLHKVLVDLKKKIDDAYDGIIESSRATWKAALAKKAEYWTPVDAEAKRLKARIGEFKDEIERKRREEEDRLTKEAIREEEERRAMEAEASPEMAAEIMSEPILVAPVVLPNEVKTEVRFRTIWDAEVTDLRALVKAVVEGGAPLACVTADEKYLRKRAGADRDQLQIPGVRVYSRRV